jgi:hypothetical protein
MQLPLLHGRWVAALVLEGHPNDLIRQVLESEDLPAPEGAELDAVRRTLRPPKGFKPRSRAHAPSTRFLEELGLTAVFRNAPEWSQARTILENPRLRELTEAGLVVGVPLKAVSSIIRSHLGLDVPAASVALFAAIFFDTTGVVRSQLRVLVRSRVQLAVRRTLKQDEDDTTVARDVTSDARVLAASLPASPLAWSSVLMSLGYSPGKLELAKVVDKMIELSAIRAGSALLRGEDGDARRADTYAAILQKMRQVRETVVTPDAELREKLTALKLVHDPQRMMSASDLLGRGDSMTVDLTPTTPMVEGITEDDDTPVS